MPYLQLTPETRIFYEVDDWTDPWTKPEAIVLIHGFAERTEAWRAWVPNLGRRYRVIRYDQPGFGLSSPVTSVSALSITPSPRPSPLFVKIPGAAGAMSTLERD